MSMGVAWGHYAYARHACVMVVRSNDGERGRKVFNYSIVHEFEGKPRKNAKELKFLKGSYREAKRGRR